MQVPSALSFPAAMVVQVAPVALLLVYACHASGVEEEMHHVWLPGRRCFISCTILQGLFQQERGGCWKPQREPGKDPEEMFRNTYAQ